jgi:hypothetical protein
LRYGRNTEAVSTASFANHCIFANLLTETDRQHEQPLIAEQLVERTKMSGVRRIPSRLHKKIWMNVAPRPLVPLPDIRPYSRWTSFSHRGTIMGVIRFD